jgi:hypothetical protein
MVSVDPAPFLILNNLPSSARKSDGTIRGKSAVSLEGGGVLGVHPNPAGANTIAGIIGGQVTKMMGRKSIARQLLEATEAVKIVDLDSILDDGGGDDDDNKSEKRKWFKFDPRHPKQQPPTSESEQGDL